MKTRIYLVRHIESEGNICRRNDAQFDCISTRKGVVIVKGRVIDEAPTLAATFGGTLPQADGHALTEILC